MNLILLQALNTLAIIIELVYDLGIAARKYVLPAVIYVAVGVYHYAQIGWDHMTSQEYTLHVYNTPLTTGLC